MTDTSPSLTATLDARAERRNERREFFRTALGATAVAAAGAAAIGLAERAFAADAVNDIDIFNFALNLEYLQANFYSFATTGAPISSDNVSGTGTRGNATGGRQVAFTDPVIKANALDFAQDQLAHVNFLRGALASSAVAQPTIDLSPAGAFTAAATAAGVISSGTFDPYASDGNFLLAAFFLEDVAVTAYKGLAPMLSTRVYLQAMAGMMATEAYHAAAVRGALYRKGVATPALRTSADKFSDARNALDGSSDDDDGISPTTPSGGWGAAANIAPTDTNGICYSRSTGQVLNILYLNKAAVTKGGFFPNGINGTVKASADNSKA